jgi:hypothetical protein
VQPRVAQLFRIGDITFANVYFSQDNCSIVDHCFACQNTARPRGGGRIDQHLGL